MRIGLVCPYDLGHPGGVQGQVLGLATELARRGHEASVLAPGRPGTHADDVLADDLVVDAGRSVPVPANGSVARLALDPRTAARARRWLDRLRPHVVHVHEPGVPLLGPAAVRAARGRDVPVVVTFHAARPSHPTDPALGRLLRLVLGRPTTSTAVSRVARELARSLYGVDPVVVPNALDVAAFAAPRGSGAAAGTGVGTGLPHGLPDELRDGAPTVLFLGRRDEPRKGLDVLRAALPRLRDDVPGVRLVLAGPGRARVDGAVDLGEVDGATRAALLHTCDVLVAPHTGRESFGIVLVEAMAAGAPVVASDLPAFREVVGAAGVLVPVGDPAALARALGLVLTDRRRARQLGTAGAERAKRWDRGVVTDRWLEVYDRACRPPRDGS